MGEEQVPLFRSSFDGLKSPDWTKKINAQCLFTLFCPFDIQMFKALNKKVIYFPLALAPCAKLS